MQNKFIKELYLEMGKWQELKGDKKLGVMFMLLGFVFLILASLQLLRLPNSVIGFILCFIAAVLFFMAGLKKIKR
jgi:hypothetical protein